MPDTDLLSMQQHILTLCLMLLQGKVQRMRPSPFHKGSGEGKPAAAAKPAASRKGRGKKAISDVSINWLPPAEMAGFAAAELQAKCAVPAMRSGSRVTQMHSHVGALAGGTEIGCQSTRFQCRMPEYCHAAVLLTSVYTLQSQDLRSDADVTLATAAASLAQACSNPAKCCLKPEPSHLHFDM